MAGSRIPTAPANNIEDQDGSQTVVSALFAEPQAAYAAIRELREIGVPTANISLISRDEDRQAQGNAQAAGVAREEVAEEGLTYRASSELPNDEDLPTTEAAMTGSPVPTASDEDASIEALLGDRERIGLGRDAGMVRRNEAETNADEDIYSDFPDQPGGVNPDSPAAANAGSDIQERMEDRAPAGGNAAAGAGIGGALGLVAGLVGLAIPGMGPFIAAGPLAGALSGLIAGSAAGGVIGALSGVGVPEEHAREYAFAIEQGQTLISVRTDSLSRDHVERVLTAHGGDGIH